MTPKVALLIQVRCEIKHQYWMSTIRQNEIPEAVSCNKPVSWEKNRCPSFKKLRKQTSHLHLCKRMHMKQINEIVLRGSTSTPDIYWALCVLIKAGDVDSTPWLKYLDWGVPSRGRKNAHKNLGLIGWEIPWGAWATANEIGRNKITTFNGRICGARNQKSQIWEKQQMNILTGTLGVFSCNIPPTGLGKSLSFKEKCIDFRLKKRRGETSFLGDLTDTPPYMDPPYKGLWGVKRPGASPI